MLWQVVCNLRHVPLLFCHRFSSRSAAVVCVASLSLGIFLLCPSRVHASASHHQSEVDYARATAIQHRLDAIPQSDRTRLQYERAFDAYRAVYHGDPASPDAARSIAAVAYLLASEGRCFHDAKLSRDAVAQWEFLRRQYPASPLRQRALLEEARIQQYDLQDRAAAKTSYRLFLAKYPHDPLANQARAGLQSDPTAVALALRQDAGKPVQAPRIATAADSAPPAPTPSNVQPSNPTPVIWVDNDDDSKPVRPTHKPVTAAKTASDTQSSTSAAVLKDVRYWDENGSTRLAVDLSNAAPYHTYSDQNGRQITIVFFGAQSAESLLNHPTAVSHDENLRSMHVSMLTPNQATLVLETKHAVSFSSFVLSNPDRLILDLHPATETDLAHLAANPIQPASKPAVEHAALTTPEAVASPTLVATPPASVAKALEGAKRTPPVPSPAYGTEPASTVTPSMARVLGLRIRRIVIDAGHGGHDSGTIGPGGVEEKDIALDVALQLGRLLQQRLGAEVIYTRRTDKYVPLEERTAIANAAHADLFLSIHANSSSDPDVRGVETYFLNFTTSPDAMAVAGRENADSNRSVYDLSDLVRKITLSDKIDESRQFAGDVQQQLYSGLLMGNAGMKNRGVKQAPFVVLIGAQMPSILAEISFLTNPEDAAELSRPRYRQRLAESLYRGVAEYVEGMSGVRIAKTIPVEALAAPAE